MSQTTVEASRPFGDFKQLVEVPGASELIVSFAESSHLSAADDVWVSETGEKVGARLFNNLRGAAAPRASASDDVASRVNLGDIVVRGPDWTADDHGDADGGAGGKGVVVAITEYMGVRNRGVSIAWQSGITNLYRWGFEGRFDVKVFQSAALGGAVPGTDSTSGLVVSGDRVFISAQVGAWGLGVCELYRFLAQIMPRLACSRMHPVPARALNLPRCHPSRSCRPHPLLLQMCARPLQLRPGRML